jgi:peptide/nickel transport system substrate-binding protein
MAASSDSTQSAPPQTQNWGGRKTMSTTVGAVILIIVILVVGGLGYVGLNAAGGTKTTSPPASCSPATNPICRASGTLNDVQLTVPYTAGYGQTFPTVTTSTLVSGYVSLKNGELANEFSINWGDGTVSNSTSSTLTHTYANSGTYIISAQALVGTVWHSGPSYLYPIQVTQSIGEISSGFTPAITATLSNASHGAIGWLEGSGSVTVNATYAAAPLDTQYTNNAPTLSVPAGSTQSAYTKSANTAQATYAFTSPGIYTINFLGSSTGPAGAIAYNNYTWTVVVTSSGLAPGCGGCSTLGKAASPHPGTLDVYEVVPGGAETLDPGVDYETVGGEVIYQVFQTLVAYNGSEAGPSAASMVPQVATCVPGSALCQSLYGQSLISSNGQYFTFAIDKAAHFYDPATKASWEVYPSDVFFSIARTLAFANLPGAGTTSGWILSQGLEPVTLATYGTIHFPYDNEPQMVLNSMLVNDSAYCPAAAMTQANGCITFNTAQSGALWPEFLSFVADNEGAGIVSCGWDSAQGATVPGFTGTSAAHGDGPCTLPDGQTSTNNSAWTSYVAGQGPTAWDAFEELELNNPNVQPNVRFNAVGSGPYYLVSVNNGIGYFLQANPAYQAPTGCAGQAGCEPEPGQYASTVNVFWEPSDTIGIQEYYAGRADAATIQGTDIPTLLSLQRQGLIGVLPFPTISVQFMGYSLDFSVSAAQAVVGSAGTINVPANFFAYDGLRQFLSYAFPYQTVENTIFTADGIQTGFNYGGAIPYGMANYYPTNISWPSTDPDYTATDVGGAAWWWAQATNPSSVYYDSQLASCTTSSPCTFPILGEQGGTQQDEMIQLWIPIIEKISGGVLKPFTIDLTFQQLVAGLVASPGTSSLPFFNLAWAPDYPDPTDYANGAMYGASSSYGTPDAIDLELNQPQFFNNGAAACGGATASVGADGSATFAALAYWTAQTSTTGGQGIPTQCQGVAYDVAIYWMGVAGGLSTSTVANSNYRVLLYNMVEHIMNGLNLYVYYDQENGLSTYAPWINPATLNTNVMQGGGAIETYYAWGGNGVS